MPELSVYYKVISYLCAELKLYSVNEVETHILNWFADRKMTNPDWWGTWECYVREGEILKAVRFFISCTIKEESATDTSIYEVYPKSDTDMPNDAENAFSGGVFDL